MTTLRNLDDGDSPYQILSKIAEGSYGRIYKARKRGTGTLVSLKALTKNITSGRTAPDVLQEVTILKMLHHKNIVHFIDFFETQEDFVIVTILAETDFSKILKDQKTLTEAEIQWLLKSILPALDYLHDLKIIHGDVKPGNILLGYDGTPLLCDFGFARMLESNTSLKGTIRGSMEYLAPEMVGQKEYDWRADLWSLGVVLFELRTGRTPFASEDLFTFLHRIEEEEVQYTAEMTTSFVNFLKGLLQKDPRDRFDWKTIRTHPFLSISPKSSNIFIVDILGQRNNGYMHSLEDYVPKAVHEMEDRLPEVVMEQKDALKAKRDELNLFIQTFEDMPTISRPSNKVFQAHLSRDISMSKVSQTFLRDLIDVEIDENDDWCESEGQDDEHQEKDLILAENVPMDNPPKTKIVKVKKKKPIGEKKEKEKAGKPKPTSNDAKSKKTAKKGKKSAKPAEKVVKKVKSSQVKDSSAVKGIKKKKGTKPKPLSFKNSLFASPASQQSPTALIHSVPVPFEPEQDSTPARNRAQSQIEPSSQLMPLRSVKTGLSIRRTSDRSTTCELSDNEINSFTEADLVPINFYSAKETDVKAVPRTIRDILFSSPSPHTVLAPFNTNHRFSLRPQHRPTNSDVSTRLTHSLGELPAPKQTHTPSNTSDQETSRLPFSPDVKSPSPGTLQKPAFGVEEHDVHKLAQSSHDMINVTGSLSRILSGRSEIDSESSEIVTSVAQTRPNDPSIQIHFEPRSGKHSVSSSGIHSKMTEGSDKPSSDPHVSGKDSSPKSGSQKSGNQMTKSFQADWKRSDADGDEGVVGEKMERRRSVGDLVDEQKKSDSAEVTEHTPNENEKENVLSKSESSSLFSPSTTPSHSLSYPITSAAMWNRQAAVIEIREKMRFFTTPTLSKALARSRREDIAARKKQKKKSRSISPAIGYPLRTFSAQARLRHRRHVETPKAGDLEWSEEETYEEEPEEEAEQNEKDDDDSRSHSTVQESNGQLHSLSEFSSDREDGQHSSGTDSTIHSIASLWNHPDLQQPAMIATARMNFGNDLLGMFAVGEDKEDEDGREEEESEEEDMSVKSGMTPKSAFGGTEITNWTENEKGRRGNVLRRGEAGSAQGSVRINHITQISTSTHSSIDANVTTRKSTIQDHPFLTMAQSATIVLPSTDLTQMNQSQLWSDVREKRSEGARTSRRGSERGRRGDRKNTEQNEEFSGILSSSLSHSFTQTRQETPVVSGTATASGGLSARRHRTHSTGIRRFSLIKDTLKKANLLRQARLLQRKIQPATLIPKDLLILSFRFLFSVKSESEPNSASPFSAPKMDVSSFFSSNVNQQTPTQSHLFTQLSLQSRADELLPKTLHTRTALSRHTSKTITHLISAFTQVLTNPGMADQDVFLSSMIVHSLLVRSGAACIPPSFFHKTNNRAHFPSPPNLLPLIFANESTSQTRLLSQALNPSTSGHFQMHTTQFPLSSFTNLTPRTPVVLSADFPHPSQTSETFSSFGTFEHSLSYSGMPYEVLGSESCSFHSPLPPFASLFRPPLPDFDFSLHKLENRRETTNQNSILITPHSSSFTPPKLDPHTYYSVKPSSPYSVELPLPIPEWLASRWGVFRWLPLDLLLPVSLPYISATATRISHIHVPYLPSSLILHSFTIDEMLEIEWTHNEGGISSSQNQHLETIFSSASHAHHIPLVSQTDVIPPSISDISEILSVDWLGVVSTFITAVHGMTHSIRAMSAVFRCVFSSLIGSFWDGTWQPLWAYVRKRQVSHDTLDCETDAEFEEKQQVLSDADLFEEDDWLISFISGIAPFFHNFFVSPSLLAHTIHPDTPEAETPQTSDELKGPCWTFLRWQHLLSLAFPSLTFSPQCAVLPRDVATHVLFASRLAHRKLELDSMQHPSSFVSPIPLDLENPLRRLVGVCPSEEIVQMYYHKQVQHLHTAACDCITSICDLLDSIGMASRLSSRAHDCFVKKILMATSAPITQLNLLPASFPTSKGFVAQMFRENDTQGRVLAHPQMIPNIITDSPLNTLQRITRELAQCLGATLFGGRWRWNSAEVQSQLVCVIHGVGSCSCVREWKSELSRGVYDQDSGNLTKYEGGKNVSAPTVDKRPKFTPPQLQTLPGTPAVSTIFADPYPSSPLFGEFDRKEEDQKHDLLTKTYIEMKGHQRLIQSTASIPILQSSTQLVLYYTLISSLSSLLSCLLFPAFPPMAENPDLIFAGEVRGTWEREFQKMTNPDPPSPIIPRSYLYSNSASSSPLPFVQALIQTVDTSIKNTDVSVKKRVSQRDYDVSSLINSEFFNFTVPPERVKEVDESSFVLGSERNEVPEILMSDPHETDYPPFPPLISFILEAYALFTLRTEDASRITPAFTTAHETTSHLLRLFLWVIKIEHEDMNYSTQPGSLFVNTRISFAEICAALFLYPSRFITRRSVLQLGCLSNYVLKFFLSEASLLDTLIYHTAKMDTVVLESQFTSSINTQQANQTQLGPVFLAEVPEQPLTLGDRNMWKECQYPFFILMASTLDRELENVTVCSFMDKEGRVTTQSSAHQAVFIDINKETPSQQSDSYMSASNQPMYFGLNNSEHHIGFIQGLYGFFSTVSVCGHFSPYLFEATMEDYHASSSDFITVPELGQQIGLVGTSRGRRRSLTKNLPEQEEDAPIITVTAHGQTEDPTSTPPVFIRLRLLMSRLSINAHLGVPFIPWTGYESSTLTTQLVRIGAMVRAPLFSEIDLPLPSYRTQSGQFSLTPEMSDRQAVSPFMATRYQLSSVGDPPSNRPTPRVQLPLPQLKKELRLSIFNLPAHMLRFSSIMSMMIPHTYPLSSLNSSFRYKQTLTSNQNPLYLIFEIIKQQPIWIPRQTLAVFTEDFRRCNQLPLLTSTVSLEKTPEPLDSFLEYSELLPPGVPMKDIVSLGTEKGAKVENPLGMTWKETEFNFGVPFPTSLHDSTDRIHARLLASAESSEHDETPQQAQDAAPVVLPWSHITASLSGILYQHHFGLISSLIQSFFAFSEAMCFSNTQVSGDVKEAFNRVETIKSSVVSQTTVQAARPSQSSRLKTRTPRLVMVGGNKVTVMRRQVTKRAMTGGFKSIKSILGGWWLASIPQLIANDGQRKVPVMALQKIKKATLPPIHVQKPTIRPPTGRPARPPEEKKDTDLNWTSSLHTLPIPAIWGASTNMFPLRSREQPDLADTHFVSSLLTGQSQDVPYRSRETEYDPTGLPVSQADLLSVSRLLAQSVSLSQQINADVADLRPTATTETPPHLSTLPLLVQMPLIQTSSFCVENSSMTRSSSSQALQSEPTSTNNQTDRGPAFTVLCSHFLPLPDTNIGTDMIIIATDTTKAVEEGNYVEDPTSTPSADSAVLLEEIPLKNGSHKMSLAVYNTSDCAQLAPDLPSTSPFPTHLSDSANPVWLVDLLVWAGYVMAAPAPTSYGLSGGVIPQFQQNSVSDGVAQSGIEYVLSFLLRVSREVLCHLQESEKQEAPIPTSLPPPYFHPPRRYHKKIQKKEDENQLKPIVTGEYDVKAVVMSAHENLDSIFYSLSMRKAIVRPVNSTSIITSMRISTDFFGCHFPNKCSGEADNHTKSMPSLSQSDTPEASEVSRHQIVQKLWLASEMGNAATQFLRPSQYFFACSVFLVLLNLLSIWDSMMEQLDSGQMRVPPTPSAFSATSPPCSASTSHFRLHQSTIRSHVLTRLSPLDSLSINTEILLHSVLRSMDQEQSSPRIIKKSKHLRDKGRVSDVDRDGEVIQRTYLANCGSIRFEILSTHTLFMFLQIMLHVFHSASRISRPSLVALEEACPTSASSASMSSMSSDGAFPLTQVGSTYIPQLCIQNSVVYAVKEGFWPNAISLFLHHSGRVLSILPTYSNPSFVSNTLDWHRKTSLLSRSIGQVQRMRARNVSSLSFIFFMMWEVTYSPLMLTELGSLMEAMLSVDSVNDDKLFADMTELQRLQSEQAWLTTFKRSHHNRLFGDTSFSSTLLQSLNNGFRSTQVIKNISETVQVMLRLSTSPFTFLFDFILVTPFDVPEVIGEKVVEEKVKDKKKRKNIVVEWGKQREQTKFRSKSISPSARSVSPFTSKPGKSIFPSLNVHQTVPNIGSLKTLNMEQESSEDLSTDLASVTTGSLQRPLSSQMSFISDQDHDEIPQSTPPQSSDEASLETSDTPNHSSRSPLTYTHITGDLHVPGLLSLTQFELLDSIVCVLNELLAQPSLRDYLVALNWDDYLIGMILFVSSLLLNSTDENDFIVPPLDLVGGKYSTLLTISELKKTVEEPAQPDGQSMYDSQTLLQNSYSEFTHRLTPTLNRNQLSSSSLFSDVPLPHYSFFVQNVSLHSSLSSTYAVPTPAFATPASPLLIRPPAYLPILRLSMCLNRMLSILHLLCSERPEIRRRIACTPSFASLLIVLSSIRSDYPSVSIYATSLPFKGTPLRSAALALMCVLSGEDEKLKVYLDCLWNDAHFHTEDDFLG